MDKEKTTLQNSASTPKNGAQFALFSKSNSSDAPMMDEREQKDSEPAYYGVPTTGTMSRLANAVMSEFRRNANHRRSSGVDQMLAYCASSSSQEYNADQKDVLRRCGIDQRNYRPLTATKVRAANAMLTDIIKQSGDKPYILSPTPLPEVPPHVKAECEELIAKEIEDFAAQNQVDPNSPEFLTAISQRTNDLLGELTRREKEWAQERCDRMDEKIHDQLIEGGFVREFTDKFVEFLSMYGTAVMIGPCPRVVSRCKCKERRTAAGFVTNYDLTYETIPVYEAVSPWDCYPAPHANKTEDGPFCIRVRYAADELYRFADSGVKEDKAIKSCWFASTVRAILEQHPQGGVSLTDVPLETERRDAAKDKLDVDRECTIEGVRCFMAVRGSILLDFGMRESQDGLKIEAHKYYKTETIVIDGYVVYCRVSDERERFPVFKSTLYPTAESWWGEAIPSLVFSAQSLQNNALKNIIQNSALSSNGIFYCNDVNRVVSLDGLPALELRAGRMIGFRQSLGQTASPIGMINVPDTTPSQLRILQESARMADDDSGIPQYSIGSSQQLSGAGRTASGLAMMTEASCRVINMAICNMGRNVIVPVVRATHVYNLIHDRDMSIKGDVEIVPSGLMGKILREAESQRRQQVTAMLGNHPILSKAIPVEGFFELLRPELVGIGVNPDRIIPSKERMALYQDIVDVANAAQAAAQAQAAQMGVQQAEAMAAPSGASDAMPTPEQANVARVEGSPEAVALQQGGLAAETTPGTVEERRNAA